MAMATKPSGFAANLVNLRKWSLEFSMLDVGTNGRRLGLDVLLHPQIKLVPSWPQPFCGNMGMSHICV